MTKGLMLLLIYVCLTMIAAICFGEQGVFWLPMVTLMLIAAYESIKRRNK